MSRTGRAEPWQFFEMVVLEEAKLSVASGVTVVGQCDGCGWRRVRYDRLAVDTSQWSGAQVVAVPGELDTLVTADVTDILERALARGELGGIRFIPAERISSGTNLRRLALELDREEGKEGTD